MTARLSTHRFTRIVATLAIAAALTTGAATQTKIVAPSNKYSPADDVKLGREAAAQAKKELPMLNDERVDDWVEDVGGRLAHAIPPEFQHPEFQFTFDVVNQSDINAFALPGGPMFLNRGMIEKAKTEGEVAGVMAHELSHVVQQDGVSGSPANTISRPSDSSEREADATAGNVLRSEPVAVSQAPSAAIQTLSTEEGLGILGGAAVLGGIGVGIAALAGAFDKEDFSQTELAAYLKHLRTNKAKEGKIGRASCRERV